MDININETIENAKQALAEDNAMSASTRAIFNILLVLVGLLMTRLGMNSKNSSKPPSTDPNREKKARASSGKKAGGQPGHVGTTLKPVEDPDEVCQILVDRNLLPAGNYQEVGFEKRQVMDIVIKRKVTEYQAQILENEQGKQFRAPFPGEVTRPVQYGYDIKTHAVYMSQFQLLPYKRIEDYFRNELGIPLSQGSLVNFNKEAYDLLEAFDTLAKQQLINATRIHADETSINVGGSRIWLHNASNDLWTYLYPHAKRGTEAMDEIGILPYFTGVLCHDHWTPYYTYTTCLHSLCNAHHLRELEAAAEQNQHWAPLMQTLLLAMNDAVIAAGGCLTKEAADDWRARYRKILQDADNECPAPIPPPIPPGGKKKRGKLKRSKERNLLERLRDYENDVLRFMETDFVPFTNNQGERDLRMSKVQQKISGCFRSLEGAKIFCRIRSYLSTCQKHGISTTQALRSLFIDKKIPDALTKTANLPVKIESAE